MANYDKMTADDFDAHLLKVLETESAASLLGIDGIYEILSEHFNNEVLDSWATGNPELAYPEDNDEEDNDEEDNDEEDSEDSDRK